MYTIYPDAAAAIAVNALEAQNRGCNMVSTLEWYPRIQHPVDGRSALKDNVGPYSYADLEADGWFV